MYDIISKSKPKRANQCLQSHACCGQRSKPPLTFPLTVTWVGIKTKKTIYLFNKTSIPTNIAQSYKSEKKVDSCRKYTKQIHPSIQTIQYTSNPSHNVHPRLWSSNKPQSHRTNHQYIRIHHLVRFRLRSRIPSRSRHNPRPSRHAGVRGWASRWGGCCFAGEVLLYF